MKLVQLNLSVPTLRNSLFRQKKSLFPEERGTGIWLQALEFTRQPAPKTVP
jgi:hypothetical protein